MRDVMMRVVSTQNTFPDDAIETPSAPPSITYKDDVPEGTSKCNRQDCELHYVPAWANTPAPCTLVEIDVDTNPAMVELVTGEDPLVTARIAPLCSPQ
jgi:hypothetical protein